MNDFKETIALEELLDENIRACSVFRELVKMAMFHENKKIAGRAFGCLRGKSFVRALYEGDGYIFAQISDDDSRFVVEVCKLPEFYEGKPIEKFTQYTY